MRRTFSLVACIGLMAVLTVSSSDARASSGTTDGPAISPSSTGLGILILDATVLGGNTSVEAEQAQDLGFAVTVVDDATWSIMSEDDFAAYDAIVLGDRVCASSSRLAAAEANVGVWSAAVTGNVVLVGTDPVFHIRNYPFTPAGTQLTRNAIRYAASQAGHTGLYLSLSCYYANAPPLTPVPVLDGFGNFAVEGQGNCPNTVEIVDPTNPVFDGLSNDSLSNWSCSVHEAFDAWPLDFQVLARAPEINDSPYILGRGAAAPTPSCGGPTIPLPGSGFWVGFRWSFSYFVSLNDGLVVRDVTLATRYMAVQMSMPYYYVQTSAFGLTRGELKPDSNDTTARSRLVGFVSTANDEHITVKATYAVDRIPPGSDSCLIIVQTYEFHKELGNGGCEPTNSIPAPLKNPSLPCNLWKFQVSYGFAGANGETLTSINVPLRMHFRDENRIGNNASTYQDRDSFIPPTPIEKSQSILEESSFRAIVQGDKGTWDNYHQTYRAKVTEPTGLPVVGPGCPECIHIHWRWGYPAGFFNASYGGHCELWASDCTAGAPMIPKDSNQDVEFAVVRYHPGEEDPPDFHPLMNRETLRNQDMVFWYSATGYHDHDTFFQHGGFFSTLSRFADLALTGSAYPGPVTAGDVLTYTFTITNNGPTRATRVVLTDVWSVGVASFEPTGSSDSCKVAPGAPEVDCDLGSIPSGQSRTITVVLHTAVAAQIRNDASVESPGEVDQNPNNNQITLLTQIVAP